MKKLTIGLIGNPNSGKTTLFNQLTGARQRVGNWAGVTVERKEGHFTTPQSDVRLVDLPGTYSLTTISEQTSLDEQIACHYILSGDADLLINVVDASNLERNLYLTLQLLELGIPCIVALNMLDIATSQHIDIDVAALSARLGCPVVPMVSTRADGIGVLETDDRQSPYQRTAGAGELSAAVAERGRHAERRHAANAAGSTAPLAGAADAGRRHLQPPAGRPRRRTAACSHPGVATAAARRPGAGDRRRALPVYRRPVRRGQQLAAGDAQPPDRDAG